VLRCFCVMLLLVLGPGGSAAGGRADAFGFDLVAIDGAPLPLEPFRGKAMLVVNTASLCGFTYQYEGLAQLDRRYRERGLVVLGVPSGDFGGQELADGAAIKTFCETRFDVEFPLAEKAHVRGPQAHPLFAWLVRQLGPAATPRWNFHKYLIAPDGRAVASWPSSVEPLDPHLLAAIELHLPQP